MAPLLTWCGAIARSDACLSKTDTMYRFSIRLQSRPSNSSQTLGSGPFKRYCGYLVSYQAPFHLGSNLPSSDGQKLVRGVRQALFKALSRAVVARPAAAAGWS